MRHTVAKAIRAIMLTVAPGPDVVTVATVPTTASTLPSLYQGETITEGKYKPSESTVRSNQVFANDQAGYACWRGSPSLRLSFSVIASCLVFAPTSFLHIDTNELVLPVGYPIVVKRRGSAIVPIGRVLPGWLPSRRGTWLGR
jgi:hypothetical protein